MADARNAAARRAIDTASIWRDRATVRSSARSLFTDDFVREDRRRLVSLPTADADTYVEMFDAWFDLADGRPVLTVEEVIAVRGERCVLVRLSVQYDGETAGGSHLLAARYDPAIDKLERMIAFDLEDEVAALAELDRLHGTSDA